ncbi:NAD(P)H-binding protein [Streptomyces sp. SID5910]|uniref:NAD(P)H-binding protein n=1 Tax=Streptomyces sp. SID5910 TaxID=2690312 RepID=UPI001371369B|nr:NAD(P)H-binding protein [Streptomyces sp. SID5910]MYR45706.1 NAD(P)H-binding protein [Streptomyces sp. SID5910]
MTSPALTLVLGGTGKTGRRVVHRLTGRGHAVRIGSRAAGIPFDWNDPTTWRPALAGVDAVYVSYQPDLAVPGAPEAIGAFADLAVRSGARRLVLLSGRGEPEAEACEKALAASGAEWTVLRASFFAQNFSEGDFLGPLLDGELALPVGDVEEPFVDADDIAEVAATVLAEGGHTGRTYDLTGPRLLTFAQATAAIAAAAGREIGYVTVPADAYAAALAAHGVPADVTALLTYLFTQVLDGRNAHLGDGVQEVLGRPARDFTDHVAEAAAAGVWAPEAAS